MNATNRISSEQFLHAWRIVWENKFSHDDYSDPFASSTKWTEFMLTGDNAFLKCVAKKLGFCERKDKNTFSKFYVVEYDRHDMVLMDTSKKSEVMCKLGADYPLMFHAIIEHENDLHPENEMWKMIFRRAPLKVIVCYNRAKEKIELMQNMLVEANAAFPENECTEYLFIVGDHHKSDIRWQWASGKPGGKLQSTLTAQERIPCQK